MEVLEAFDLTGSLRDAARLAGCSHHTVARYVAAREAGGRLDRAAVRPQLIDEYLPKVTEWVTLSRGSIRADKAHEKLLALGFAGSERTTRRAVHAAKVAFNLGQVRVHRPWVTEPGMWLQCDFGDGPVIEGRKTVLFCAWLAWSRFRVVLALRDRTAPSVFAALDVTLRRLGGAPTYLLTDNEKTVTTGHIAGIAVRNPQVVSFARHYGVTVHTCEPCDPATKGGSESTVKIAKADLVPTTANLLAAYPTFAELEVACAQFCATVNARVHRVTRRPPVQMLTEEQDRLHRLPDAPHTVAFGLSRMVAARTPMVALDGAQYSVPHQLLGQQVWVRVHGQGAGEKVVIVHVTTAGPLEVARHDRAQPGSPSIDDAHFPPAPAGALQRRPRANNPAEADFLALGAGARMWLTEAAAAGSTKMRVKMAAAVALAKLGDPVKVDWALGHAAVNSRFAEADLASILDHHARTNPGPRHQASETRSLTQGTRGWSALATTSPPTPAPAPAPQGAAAQALAVVIDADADAGQVGR